MQTGKPWPSRLRFAGLAAALFLLNASLTFESAWPTPGIRWHGALSIELVALVLLLMAAWPWLGASSRPPGPAEAGHYFRLDAASGFSRTVIRWVAALWLALVIGRYAEVTASALYGRNINLFWDLRFVPDVVALLARPERLWVVVLAPVAALLFLVLLYRLLVWAVVQLGEGMVRPSERRALGAMAATILGLFVAQRAGADLPRTLFPPPVTQTYVRQGRLMAATLGRSTTIGPSPAMNSDLSRVDGADVFLIFIEAYGAVSYERPEFAARLAADRTQLERAVHEAGAGAVSAYVESPTFGGSSWLAHISLLSGVEVRDHDTNALLMTERRDTLVTPFKRHGYRAVAVMPGTWQSWPEGAFYGFDDIYGGARLDYRGPGFGWWDMTDQFVLARMNALEVSRASRPPLFVFFPTVSTHVPFTPIPPYQPDWARVLTDDPYDERELNQAYLRQPDWMDLGSSYADALSYTYRSLAGYLRLRGPQEFVMILVGDHQPAAAVSGEGAAWDVPMHVIASRRPVLDRLLGHGFRSGLEPARPSLGPMHTLTPVLVEAFGDRQHSTTGPADASNTQR